MYTDKAIELGHRDASLYNCNWPEGVAGGQMSPVCSSTRAMGHQVKLPRATLDMPREVACATAGNRAAAQLTLRHGGYLHGTRRRLDMRCGWCHVGPARGVSAPVTLLGAKARAEGSRQELLAPGVGRIPPCLQACPMVLMGHLGAPSLQGNEDVDRRQMTSPCGGISFPQEAWLKSREQDGAETQGGHGSQTCMGASLSSPPAAQQGKSQGQR